MKLIARQKDYKDIFDNIDIIGIFSSEYRTKITAAISTREMVKQLVRVKSSNIWAYGMNVRNAKDKTGDVMVQFKGKDGGPDDVYIYYDVPLTVYRRWLSAPSKGHYLWRYIRGRYKFAKLTGDKKTKMPGGVNS